MIVNKNHSAYKSLYNKYRYNDKSCFKWIDLKKNLAFQLFHSIYIAYTYNQETICAWYNTLLHTKFSIAEIKLIKDKF